MAEGLRVGIIGGGWPGGAHAAGYQAAGGFKIVAVADLIPDRRKQVMQKFGATREFADAEKLVDDKEIDVVSICLPNDLHAPIATRALRAGKHVICELPVALSATDARKMATAASKYGKVLLYAAFRRFGANEQAAAQALSKGYAGQPYHARASWMRTRGVPIGTGWFADRARSGGGAMIDLGVHMLDLAWKLLGQPKPVSAFAATHRQVSPAIAHQLSQPGMSTPARADSHVEDAAFAMLRFEGNASLELATSWAINQPPNQQGAVCRIFAGSGALDVYTANGATLYRKFNDKGECEAVPVKSPKSLGHAAMMRHFKDCIHGKEKPAIGGPEGVALASMVDAIYKSAASGKSVDVKS